MKSRTVGPLTERRSKSRESGGVPRTGSSMKGGRFVPRTKNLSCRG